MLLKIDGYISSAMSNHFKFLSLFLVTIFFLLPIKATSSVNEIGDFEYVIRRINDFPLEKEISKSYDLYELYLENRTENTLSIPGYSIDFGVNYINIADLSSELKNRLSKKFTILSIATGAASFAFGSLARSAANTAVQSVASWKKRSINLSNNEQILNSRLTYVLYPYSEISLFFLVRKDISEPIHSLKLICVNEELGQKFILINNMVGIHEYIVKNKKEVKKKFSEQGFSNLYYDVDNSPDDEIIAVPGSDYE